MDEKLFELCKEVSEKTRWGDGLEKDYQLQKNDTVLKAPRYTSDYLLEKLPHTLTGLWGNKDGDNWLSLTNSDGLWCASYEEVVFLKGKPFVGCFDDTPLKALLKLTLALDEAGELK